MSTFVPPASPRRRHAVRQAANRVPLRVKLITAVLALVVIALVVISVVSINLYRDYQLNRATQQVTALYRHRGERDQRAVDAALAALVAAARTQDNLVPPMLVAARAEATLGEICGALRAEWGAYTEPAAF